MVFGWINRSSAATDHSRDQNLVMSIKMTRTLFTRQVDTEGASFMFEQQQVSEQV